MKAWRIAAGISCCLLFASGCSVCQHPYYYCGPVWSEGARPNCDLDYRAGSVLNRHELGAMQAESVPAAAGPSPRAARPAQVAAQRSAGLEPRARPTTVAQRRPTPKPAPAERQSAQAQPKRAVAPKAPLPPDTVAAPAKTKEGDRRIASVTDRRSNELRKSPKPLAAQRKSPQRTEEKSGESFDGWRPVATRQDPTETAK